MSKLVYTPKALEDLQGVKTYVTKQYGESKAKISVKETTSAIRKLEIFPYEGPGLEELINYPTDYHYLVVKPNYVFYRIEDDTVKVIRILNENQDFLQILFGISSISEEGEDYWDRMDRN
ncbi:MAG: type II toxin-antitoxin system RelE/ParE family toxin [Lachnospiraceae bacterium]|nr:type II toxin-antitoxin system RelE/ParE family toxin [Lachnospiraceae bacterium]